MGLSAIAALLLCFGGSSWARAGEPLEIAKQGYFYVGGHYVKTPAGTVMDGQMFVQYQIPAHRRHPFPIVFIHGQNQSGVNFLGTPDGREGWAEYMLRDGYAVYVVDQPLRGRSAYHAKEDGAIHTWSAEEVEIGFTHPEGRLLWPQAKLHNQWPGTGLKGDPVFDQFYASQLDSSDDNLRMDQLNRDADVALLEKIGPAIVLTHSRSGSFGWLLADARSGLVKAIVAIEPWGPPFRDTFPKVSGIIRPWGLTVAPLTYDPPVGSPADLAPQEEARPRGPGMDKCWMPSGTHRTLPHLAGIPVLIVTGEASYHNLYDACTSAFLKQAGVKNDWMRLGKIGIHGNGHMMMLEKNNGVIAAAIQRWLQKKLTGAEAAASARAAAGADSHHSH